ncbi:MAG: phage tail protein [Caldilineaceae bacterium]|nr:phage tail protein [Caldilineaceae bacterium]
MTTLGINAAFSAGSSLLGIRNDPYLTFNFLVEIESLVVGGFSEVTGLQVDTEVETYREGGQNEYEHKFAGPTKYSSNLILKHGLIDIETLWSWHQDVTQGQIKRRNGTIYLLDHQRLPAMWWDFRAAYPIKWTGPDLRADSNTVALETVELVHQGIVKPTASSALSAARGVLGAVADLGGSVSPF